MSRRRYLLVFCLVTTTAVAQQPVLDSIITPSSLKEIIQVLAADSLMGRLTGSAGHEQAANYIAAEFRKAGLSPVAGNDGYFMPFTYSWDGESNASKNIVGVLPGSTNGKELILFSAHYDHVGTLNTNPVNFMPERGRPEKGDTIYNGANDNASGISAIISMARYFGKVRNNERTIVFIAFSGEELGLVGSREMAKSMDIQYIKAMINMDMIGIPTGRKNKSPFITGYQLSDLPSLLNKELYEANPGLYGKEYFRHDPFTTEHLFSRSDNLWFAMQGIPAHTIIATSSTNPYYHSLNDEPRTLDYNNLAAIIKAIVIGSVGIITGTQTPGRLQTDRINNY